MIKQSDCLDIYTRIKYKAQNSIELSPDEREKLENLLIDQYTEWVSRVDDEILCQEALDKGAI